MGSSMISLWNFRRLTWKMVLCHIPFRFVDGEKKAHLIDGSMVLSPSCTPETFIRCVSLFVFMQLFA